MFKKIKYRVGIGLCLFVATKIFSNGCSTNNACIPSRALVSRSTFSVDDDCEINNINFCKNDRIYGKTFFSYRPQDSNAATKIVGLLDQNKRFNFSFGYQSSFRNEDKLAKWFLFNGKNCMSVGIPGEAVDVVGSQIGLSLGSSGIDLRTGAIGEFCVKPSVQNYIFNFDWNIDLSSCCDCFWARVSTAVVRAETNMHACSVGDGNNLEPYPVGLFTQDCTTTPVPYTNIAEAFEGDKGFGDVPALYYSKFPRCKLKKTAVPSVALVLGYDVCRRDEAYLGVGLNMVIPTGNRPKGKYLLEPIVGANHNFQLGGLLEFYKTWGCRGLYFYGTVNHLFGSKQFRTFALKNNGAGSQFLLLKQYNTLSSGIVGLNRAADILNGYANIGSDVMADAAIMLQYSGDRFFMNLGYNLWVRTKEKVKGIVNFSGFQNGQFGIKGNLVESYSDLVVPVPRCRKFTVTASKSTINSMAPTDVATIFLDAANDIDMGAALHPLAISNKIFASIGFTFYDVDAQCEPVLCKNIEKPECYLSKAFFALSGELEFGNKAALDQWSVTGKIGIDF